jgi:phosphoserine phosphatase
MKARVVAFVVACLCTLAFRDSPTPLPSWNEGSTRTAIVDFVSKVTTPNSPTFVPPPERIAVFDNDGTLWVEQPMYVQLRFALDRVKALAPQHPEWANTAPFNAVLEGDMAAVAKSGQRGLAPIMMATHAGMTTDEFEPIVSSWIATAKHPRFDRLYTELVYQPMLEVLSYFRANGFKTFIVSGGGVDFMRPWADRVYGVPPEQVIGSAIRTRFEMRDGKPVLIRLPDMDFVDDQDGKAIAIERIIGRRPIAAFGNSDGDLEMLQWTAAGAGARLCVIVHHTDALREYAYDRMSKFGKLDVALDYGSRHGWTFADMKRDWNRVF